MKVKLSSWRSKKKGCLHLGSTEVGCHARTHWQIQPFGHGHAEESAEAWGLHGRPWSAHARHIRPLALPDARRILQKPARQRRSATATAAQVLRRHALTQSRPQFVTHLRSPLAVFHGSCGNRLCSGEWSREDGARRAGPAERDAGNRRT